MTDVYPAMPVPGDPSADTLALEAVDILVAPAPTGTAAHIGAIFDVDRTLLPGTTAERLFLRFLRQHGELGARAILETAWFAARHLHAPRTILQGVRRHRPYLRGKEVAAMERLGAECFEREIAPRLAVRGVAVLRDHLVAGHTTVLLSGGLWFLIEPMAAYLGAHHAIATRLATRVSRGRGRTRAPVLAASLTGPHPYGAAKAELLARFAARNGLDLAQSYSYADHHTDAAMLALVGHPVCVNPDTGLRREAIRRGWPIEEFR